MAGDAAVVIHSHPSIDDIVVHEARDLQKTHFEACAVKELARRFTIRRKVFLYICQTSAHDDSNGQVAAEYSSALAKNDPTLLAKGDPAPLVNRYGYLAGKRSFCRWVSRCPHAR